MTNETPSSETSRGIAKEVVKALILFGVCLITACVFGFIERPGLLLIPLGLLLIFGTHYLIKIMVLTTLEEDIAITGTAGIATFVAGLMLLFMQQQAALMAMLTGLGTFLVAISALAYYFNHSLAQNSARPNNP